MAPNLNSKETTGILYEEENEQEINKNTDGHNHNVADPNWKTMEHIVWRNVIIYSILHVVALYGLYLTVTLQVKFLTVIFGIFMYFFGLLGITAGNHRLWSHKSYKARLPLRILLALFQTIAVQNSIYEWSRDHRVHHKFSETDADPHNASRGFFFAHMGWLLTKKHPDVIRKGKMLDLKDLEEDAVVMMQKKYYWYLVLVFTVIIPTLIPYYVWGEGYIASYCVAVALRHSITLHMTWLVNSAAHMFGNKPYDLNINPSENSFVSLGAFGEGWHNYHHTFPWDYKTSELGFQGKLNVTAGFIDLCASLGLAYDLKSVSKEVIEKRVKRTGDGSHAVWGEGENHLNEDFGRKSD